MEGRVATVARLLTAQDPSLHSHRFPLTLPIPCSTDYNYAYNIQTYQYKLLDQTTTQKHVTQENCSNHYKSRGITMAESSSDETIKATWANRG